MKTAATAESPATRNLSQRLESLPFTRKHTKLLGVTGIGWALDAMDVGLIGLQASEIIYKANSERIAGLFVDG
ncbi:MAG: MFS transporter, partial [Rothia aeria]